MLEHIDNFVLDMDGVLWHGDTPMPGFVDFFATLRQTNRKFVLATNNASKTPAQYIERFANFGVEIEEEQLLTSAEATGSYLADKYEKGTAVFIIGGDGIHHAMTRRGFNVLTVEDVMMSGKRAEIVVVGFWRDVSYKAFAAGAVCINHGAAFVGTNPDVSFPSEWGNLPGAGSFLALLEAATGKTPITVGKPGAIIFQDALKRLGGSKENTAMVGDRLNTDIAGANDAGLHSILVLSGISTREDIANTNGNQPDFVFEDISELAKNLVARDVTL